MFETEKDLYSPKYFKKEFEESNRASAVIVPMILEYISPRSVLDVGCGAAAFLRRFRNHGVPHVLGVDGDYIPSWLCCIGDLEILIHDLKTPLYVGDFFDLAMCLEVAEHLPENCADTLVNSICDHADVVVFSAAVPGQGGVSHINEQPHDYWKAKFAEHGYQQIDCLRPRLQDELALREVAPWYRNNIFFYANKEGLDRYGKLNLALTLEKT